MDCGGDLCTACANNRACNANLDCSSGRCVGTVCRPAHCTNNTQDNDETGVDCGGSCGACSGTGCTNGSECTSGVCDSGGQCADPTCNDGVRNGSETDIDCGGSCGATCGSGAYCSSGDDCVEGACATTCQEPTCSDNVENGDETDTDCGGSCPGCGLGEGCGSITDCSSGNCVGGYCVAGHCENTIQDMGETDIDCGGGECAPCANNEKCNAGTDCVNEICGFANTCTTTPCTCLAPGCSDGVQNLDETDVDCGGGTCGACNDGDDCEFSTDCQSAICGFGNTCLTPPCTCQTIGCNDGVQNLSETDIDCGGGTCSACANGDNCDTSTDCQSNICGYGDTCTTPPCTCQTIGCFDGVQNGSETDIDCGGSCAAGCSDGEMCADGTDCQSGICEFGNNCVTSPCFCQTIGCSDGVQNGDETAIDCGGGTCSGCGAGAPCSGAADCQSGFCHPTSNTCQASSCDPVDGIKNGQETDVDCGGPACPDCPNGSDCNQGSDCQSGICGVGGSCPTPPCQCESPSCGDGSKNGTEVCDNGVDVEPGTPVDDDLGGQTCLSQGFAGGGTLACNGTCDGFITSGCSSTSTCSPSCTGGKECVASACVCPQGTLDCGGTCVAPSTNPDHCGGCGDASCSSHSDQSTCETNGCHWDGAQCLTHICGGAEACSAGVCTANCQTPLITCDRQCVDTESNNEHCGGCNTSGGTDCTLSGQLCNNGACETPIATLTKPAKCVGSGPPIVFETVTSGGGSECSGNLASVTFRWGVCSCDDLTIGQGLVTDGFNSNEGPYDPANPGTGAGAGANGAFTVAGPYGSIIRGALWASGQASSTTPVIGTKQVIVDQGFYCGGNMNAQGGTFGVDEGCDAYSTQINCEAAGCLWSGSACENNVYSGAYTGDSEIEGDISISGNQNVTLTGDLAQSPGQSISNRFTVNGTLDTSATVSVSNPCDCSPDRLIDVASIISDHDCSGGGGTTGCDGKNNDNEEAGLQPDVFDGAGGGRLDIDCGNYYFTNISPGADTTIHISGNAAFYVDGDMAVTGGQLTISLDPTAQLDIFVRKAVCGTQPVRLGSANYAANLRIYIGDPNTPPDICAGATVPSSLVINQNADIAGNIYAPYFTTSLNQPLRMYGSLFVGCPGTDCDAIAGNQPVFVHFDRAVVEVGEICSECGNGEIDAGETCDGTAFGGRTCISEGFDGGQLACHAPGTGNECTVDTSGCFACGNNTREGPEQCDGPDLGSCAACDPDCTCAASASCDNDGTCEPANSESCDTADFCGDTCVTLGFDGPASGGLACTATCEIDTTGCYICGDGAKNPGEECDGADLGGETCAGLGLGSGTLACSGNCAYDTSGCGSAGCEGCQDCNNQACIGGLCTSCTQNTDCCAPLVCFAGQCVLF